MISDVFTIKMLFGERRTNSLLDTKKNKTLEVNTQHMSFTETLTSLGQHAILLLIDQ